MLLITTLFIEEDKMIEYIQFGVAIFLVLSVVTVIIGVYMKFANHIGEVFGMGNLFAKLCRKTRRKK